MMLRDTCYITVFLHDAITDFYDKPKLPKKKIELRLPHALKKQKLEEYIFKRFSIKLPK